MTRILTAIFVLLAVSALYPMPQTTPVSQEERVAAIERRIDEVMSRLSLEEKVQFLQGDGHYASLGNPTLGLPSIKMADGPQAVRAGGPATIFPSPVAMAATWDVELIERVSAALGRELRAKGHDMLLAPCLNIHRSPLGGRNTESFGEDPLLAAKMAIAYVKGVQSQGAAACVKHFAANNIETWRKFLDVRADQRFLHEIEFPAFRAAVQEGGALAVMAAYNKLNGAYCWASRDLLTGVLRKQWGFQGIIISDWGCEWFLPEPARTVEAANAGLNIHMPSGRAYGEPLLKAIMQGQVSQAAVDGLVRQVLRLIFELGLGDENRRPDPTKANTKEHQSLSREVAASSIVLLKNDGAVLPLDRSHIKSLAVIGPNADVARLGDRGSAYAPPFYTVSPLEGLQNKLGKAVTIRQAKGYTIEKFKPIPPDALAPPNGRRGEQGLRGEYFSNKDWQGHPAFTRIVRQAASGSFDFLKLTSPAFTRIDRQINFDWKANAPGKGLPPDQFAVRWTGRLVPRESKTWFLGLRSQGLSRLYVDGRLLIENRAGDPSVVKSARFDLRAGQAREISIEYIRGEKGDSIELLWATPPPNPFQEAVEAARASDVTLVFAGLNTDCEGENMDRFSMDLPGLQDELIQSVVKANPRTVVVLISGTPNHMTRWIDQVPAVVQAWYPGMEGGNAIADVLFGDVNPSGKLPVTFARRREDYPDWPNFPGENDVVRYAESIFVGYRHFDAKKITPLYPFGHGLSYTTFEYSNLNVQPVAGDNEIEVSLEVKNTGLREGREVVQLYVSDLESRLPRPPKELKAFRKVRLSPGQTERVVFRLDRNALSYYDPDRSVWVFEPGRFEILVGGSSRDIRLRKPIEVR